MKNYTKNDIQELMNLARKSGDKVALDAYSAVLGSIQSLESKKNLSDENILQIIDRESKIFNESSDVFAKHDKNKSQLEKQKSILLEKLLPQKIQDSEYDEIIDSAIENLSAKTIKDMGKTIGFLKNKYGLTLDLAKVSAMVKEKLS